ncbi:MAG: glycosyltransferase family 4 protein [Ignavibacteriota bacterium]
MHILQLTPRLPYPLTDGGAIGLYKPIEAVAKLGHYITLVTYPDLNPALTQEAFERLSQFSKVEIVPKTLPSITSTLLRTVFSGAYPIERRMMPEMFTLLGRLMSENSFDIIHVDHAHMGKYGLWLKERYNVPIVLREHNYETLIYERFAANEKNPLKKLIAATHGKRLRTEEARFFREFDTTIPITPQDEALMRAEVPGATYSTIPAGVDLADFKPSDTPEVPNTILWIGGTNWRPNLDAIEFFAKEIFPLVVKTIPDAKFDIVGENTDKLQHIVNSGVSNITLHGRVPDIRPFMSRSAVMICPLRVGGGMRLKLLDFFAAGKAVVSTSIGAEGNAAKDGEHLLLRDDPKSFAEGVIGLLGDEASRRKLGSKARVLVESEYSWESIGKRFCDVYEEVISKH